MANRFVQAPSHGGAFRAGAPRLIVIHSLEAPAKRGLAYSLAGGWIQTAGVSPQHITDPGETVDCLRPGVVGWHCGNGNQVSVGLEVTGRAGWSAAEWLEPEAFAAVRLDAKQGAVVAKHYGIPMRWLSLQQIRNGERGFCTHNDISLTLGGTNHWDPGPNFPFAVFMQMVQQFAGGWDGLRDDFKPSTPSAGGGVGAEPGGFLMALTDTQQSEVYNWLKRLFASEEIPGVYYTKTAANFNDTREVDAKVKALQGEVAAIRKLLQEQVVDRILPKGKPYDNFQDILGSQFPDVDKALAAISAKIDALTPKA